MNTAKSVTSPTTHSGLQERSAPVSSRTIAVSVVAAFVIGGLLWGTVPLWAFVVAALVIGALALYGMNRHGHSRG